MRLRLVLLLALAAMSALLAGCASHRNSMSDLERAQYAWSAAIRWGDFEGAWNLVAPDWRQAHPLTDLQLERYKQIQVSHYREMGAEAGDTQARREIEIGLVNRHTMTERTLRYTERWRFDPEARSWWIVDGLPDFWAGE